MSAGFSLLMLSRFEILFLVGFLTIISAVTAVVADLFLFPAIVRVGWGALTTTSATHGEASPVSASLSVRGGHTPAPTPAE